MAAQQFYQQIYLHSALLLQINHMEQHLESLLDRSINQEYQDICFNPTKKQVLRRLTQQPHLYHQIMHDPTYFNHPPAFSINNNHSLNLYVQHVYHKYNIQDPIDRSFRRAHMENIHDSSYLNTPNKETQTKQSTTKTQKHTTTQQKLTQMRQKYKQDSNDIVSSAFYPFQPTSKPRRASEITQSRIAKQIGYRTREKMHFKTHTNEDIPLPQKPLNSERPPNATKQPNLKITFKYNPEQPRRERRQRAVSQIPVSFRYCPMCQQVILQGNIVYHQRKCKPIQEAYRMPLKQLQKAIKRKTQRMKQQVQKQLREQSDNRIVKEYQNLNKSIVQWLSSQDQQSFQSIKQGYQKVALKQFELVAKLKWFKRLHKTIVGQMNSISN